jgi:hypothetical protein
MDEEVARFQRRADWVSFLIVATDCPESQIAVERLNLRTEAARLFPEKYYLYDMIYESRFRRLWQQFRESTA